jgi:hypothetical protein
MIILVDFDNIHRSILRLGISHVVQRIVSKIDVSDVANDKRINLRLYGGWYEQNRFTHRAQLLGADLIANFPTTALLSDNSTAVIVNCDMAYSILADPGNHLFHTFRPRGIPSGLGVRHPSQVGCQNTLCSLVETFNFLQGNGCPQCGLIKPSDLFFRGEQKLVDTMLTSDLIFSSSQNSILAIVSSDDDFWPGIKTTLSLGKKIIQIHTRSRATPSYYTRTTTSNFVQRQL